MQTNNHNQKVLAGTAALSYAQVARTDSAAQARWTQFNQAQENHLNVVWDQSSGRFSKMLGITRSFGRTPDQAVNNFLDQESTLLGLTSNHSLRQVKRINSRRGQVKFRYEQAYKDIPVLNSGYLISGTENGEINYISGDFYEDISLDVTPEYNADQVITAIEIDLGETALDFWKEPELSIYPQLSENKTEAFVLIWHARVRVEGQPEAWRYYIDAKDGSIIEKKSLVDDVHSVHHGSVENEINEETEAARMRRVNGSGKVYVASPNHGSTVTRTLHRLDNVSPRRLEGDNVSVDYYNQTNATSSTGTFNYSPSNAHFDEVMAYYHSDEFETWLIGQGMGATRVAKVSVTTRYNTGFAFAIPSAREVYFQSGASGLNNPTHEAAVIAHEYMHVVSETYHDLVQDEQTDAMDEAYSDYFGISYRDDFGGVSSSIIGEYIDQPGGYNYERDLDNYWTMDDYATINFDGLSGSSYHEKSVIFSGALWDFRSDPNVNAGIADELVLESLGNLDANTNFLDGMYALIAAAQSSGYSSYVDDIEDAFIGKEIYSPSLSVTISGPGHIPAGSGAQYTANVSDGDSPYSYQWKKDGVNVGTSSTYNLSTSPSDEGPVMLSVTVTDDNNITGSDNHSVFVDPFLKKVAVSVPEDFALSGNYPNPFNPSTHISYQLPEQSSVTLEVFDLMGRKVATLVNANQAPGTYTERFDAFGLSSGLYIARIDAAGNSGAIFTQELKMQLIK